MLLKGFVHHDLNVLGVNNWSLDDGGNRRDLDHRGDGGLDKGLRRLIIDHLSADTVQVFVIMSFP